MVLQNCALPEISVRSDLNGKIHSMLVAAIFRPLGRWLSSQPGLLTESEWLWISIAEVGGTIDPDDMITGV